MADKVVARTRFTKKESLELIELILEIIKDTVTSGETVKVSGFGSFILKEKNNRIGRNPQTGEEMTIEARRILTFKSSLVLKAAINESNH